jgi:hypothetical protein
MVFSNAEFTRKSQRLVLSQRVMELSVLEMEAPRSMAGVLLSAITPYVACAEAQVGRYGHTHVVATEIMNPEAD